MKAVVFISKENLVVEEREIPKLKNNEGLVKVKAYGICGTDIHIFKGEYYAKFPLKLDLVMNIQES